MNLRRCAPVERLCLVACLPDRYRQELDKSETDLLARVEAWLGVAQPPTPGPLLTPFSRLFVPPVAGLSACSSPDPAYWSADPLAYPGKTEPDAIEALGAWEESVAHLSYPVEMPCGRLYSAVFGLVQKHLRTVAADAPDIPQALQRQLTGAHAAALWRAEEQGEPDAGFALLIADLSGIQNYLFGTAAFGVGGVARSLRARSFYLTQIATLFAWDLLARLSLPPSNLLLDAGGKVYLLFAPTLASVAAVEEAKMRAARSWGLEQMHGELTINLAYARYGPEALQEGAFGDVWREANRAVSEEKQRRLGGALHNATGWNEESFLFKNEFEGHEPCAACRRFPQRAGDDRCIACRRDEDLGKILPLVAWIAYERMGPLDLQEATDDREPTPKSQEITAFGWRALVGVAGSRPPDSAEWVVVLEPDRMRQSVPAPTRTIARYVPVSAKREPLTFEEIAAQSKGRPCLAYLKADVDRLGERFAFGLRDPSGKSRASLPRLAHLSRALEAFFGGELERMVREEFPACYIVFSGGDDLTVIGPYDQILRLSTRLVQNFRRFQGYTAGLPQPTDVLTLSAGLALVTPRVPVSTAIPRADHALKAAKRDGRNGIHLLGRTLEWPAYDRLLARFWDAEGNVVPGLGQEMLQGVSSGFLYHLLQYAAMWESYREGDRAGLRFQPLLAYEIGRNVDPKKTPVVHDWAGWLTEIPLEDKRNWQEAMNDLGLFTRIALLARGGGAGSGRAA